MKRPLGLSHHGDLAASGEAASALRQPLGLSHQGDVAASSEAAIWSSSVWGSQYMAPEATQRLLGIQHVRSVNGPVLVVVVLPPYSL